MSLQELFCSQLSAGATKPLAKSISFITEPLNESNPFRKCLSIEFKKLATIFMDRLED